MGIAGLTGDRKPSMSESVRHIGPVDRPGTGCLPPHGRSRHSVTRKIGSAMARFIEELTEKLRARNIAKGRAIGCATERVEWNSWADRKEAAETKGEPFDEPRPGSGTEETDDS